MQKSYEEFCLGCSYRRSLFCDTMHRIQRKLEPFVPPMGFMWSNLFTCDENGKTPTDAVADVLRRFRILPNEIAILRPDAVIFLSGPNYDYTVNAFFPNCQYTPVAPEIPTRQLAHLAHENLPPSSFRTYHPNSLRQQNKLDYLDKIAAAIRTSWETNPA
jgi:hypothetical protein